MLILVRHALPAIDESIAPERWSLAPEGRIAAGALPIPEGAYLVASDEPKAILTLAPSGQVVVDPRFGEVRRPLEPFGGDAWRRARLSYVEGADHAGWEPRAAVVARFDEAVNDHRVRAADRPVVVASHGMAMTLWLTARVGLPAPGDFWSALRLPDAYRVDLTAGTVYRL